MFLLIFWRWKWAAHLDGWRQLAPSYWPVPPQRRFYRLYNDTFLALSIDFHWWMIWAYDWVCITLKHILAVLIGNNKTWCTYNPWVLLKVNATVSGWVLYMFVPELLFWLHCPGSAGELVYLTNLSRWHYSEISNCGCISNRSRTPNFLL